MSWGIVFRARQHVKGSLWLLPAIGAVVGILLSDVGLWFDAHPLNSDVLRYSSETATAILSAIIGASAALTGFVVTATVLGVQMATGTFSPRYMRLWYRDVMLKLLLAELIGTLTFSFWTFRDVQPGSVPDISVTAAGIAVALGMILFVVYLDRFLHRMRPVAVAALVAAEGRRALADWVKEASRPDTAYVARGVYSGPDDPTFVLRARRPGTIQAVDTRGLTAFARRQGCLVVFLRSVGDFVTVGSSILELHHADPPRAARERLEGMIALGEEWTIEQDPAFALRIMVDVATRALSPAVNDPTTAVQVLDHLGETLRLIGTTTVSQPVAVAEALQSGVVMPVRHWPEYLSLGVTEIREYGATSIQVVRRLRGLLLELGAAVPAENRIAVDDELRRLDATVHESFGGGADLDLALTADAQGLGGPMGQSASPRPS